MTSLAVAAAGFALLHIGIAGGPLRKVLVGLLGEQPYRGLFSVVTFGLLGWMIWSYRAAFASGNLMLWDFGPGARHAAAPIMLIAFFFAGIGMLSPNPTSVGQEGVLEKEPKPRGIQRITRHPFLWSVMLWSATHLVANGDLASIILFGTFLIVAAIGTVSIDRKRAGRLGTRWTQYAAETSNVPFAAILTGRTKLSFREIGWWRPVAALVAFGAVVSIHPWLFGAYPLPGMAD